MKMLINERRTVMEKNEKESETIWLNVDYNNKYFEE